jgi:hypothetical protein
LGGGDDLSSFFEREWSKIMFQNNFTYLPLLEGASIKYVSGVSFYPTYPLTLRVSAKIYTYFSVTKF